MRKAFSKDNRMVPLGIMLTTLIIFLYHFELDRPAPVASPLSPSPHTVSTQFVQEQVHSPASTPKADAPSSAYYNHNHDPAPSPISSSSSSSSLSITDITLMFKTGASVLWKRVPIHLTTSLSPQRIPATNVLLYSDAPETIGSWNFLDVLANTSSTVQQSPDFLPYIQQADYDNRQNYAEISNMPGDAAGPVGGWKLDKYKFLPIVAHAGRAHPDSKWYIFMEDDSYIFLPNLLTHLDRFDPSEPWYLGSVAWIHGDFFAHGGSGFALSRGAWEKSFGADPDIVTKYEGFTAEHGCGDHILGHVLKDYGVGFGEDPTAENRFAYGFNPEAHWSTWFESENWCKPVYSWHHTHGRDVARLFGLESGWDFSKGQLRYRDVFDALVKPYLRTRIEWWDNGAAKYEIRSNNVQWAQIPEGVKETETWKKGWRSVDACQAACVAWGECVQWSFYEDRCKMDSMVLLGSGIPEGDSRRQTSLPWTSGWMKERIEKWACDSDV
ncbi:hypothetical protein BO70DRAFT_315745, partial [Aspergillus heteromorphus CBS 117.55]